MPFLWFDHPLIEGWTEARLRAELHREGPTASNDRPLQGLEIFSVEFFPRPTRELVEPNAIHRGDHQDPAFHNGRWTRAFMSARLREHRTRNVVDGRLRRRAAHEGELVDHI